MKASKQAINPSTTSSGYHRILLLELHNLNDHVVPNHMNSMKLTITFIGSPSITTVKIHISLISAFHCVPVCVHSGFVYV